MQSKFILHYGLTIILSITLAISGCTMLEPAKKPDIGPAGNPTQSKPNPPLTERFISPPSELYDMEATAGVIFEGINKNDWNQAVSGLSTLQTLFQTSITLTGEKKGIKDANEALDKLTTAITEKNNLNAYESLNKFMASIGDVGKSYKLSPLSDIIAVDNAIRNVSYYTQIKDWKKTAAKAEELDGTWKQAKPSIEKVGILDEVTKSHAAINQIKDAAKAENQGVLEEQITNLNESMGRIRDYYRGK